MKQLTLRGFEPDLVRRLEQLARSEGISLNKAALRLMKRGAGLHHREPAEDRIGNTLDRFVGSWSEIEEREFLSAIESFDKVDDDLWK